MQVCFCFYIITLPWHNHQFNKAVVVTSFAAWKPDWATSNQRDKLFDHMIKSSSPQVGIRWTPRGPNYTIFVGKVIRANLLCEQKVVDVHLILYRHIEHYQKYRRTKTSGRNISYLLIIAWYDRKTVLY